MYGGWRLSPSPNWYGLGSLGVGPRASNFICFSMFIIPGVQISNAFRLFSLSFDGFRLFLMISDDLRCIIDAIPTSVQIVWKTLQPRISVNSFHAGTGNRSLGWLLSLISMFFEVFPMIFIDL